MDYRYTLYHSIDEIDPDQWNRLRRGRGDPSMDPRFIKAVQTSMADTAKFWYVMIRDPGENPVACACLYLYHLDLRLVTDGRLKRAVRLIGRMIPRLSTARLLFCGLPGTPGESQLRLAPQADSAAVLRLLDEILLEIAADEGARCVSFAEFDDEECAQLGPLEELGYLRVTGMPDNHIRSEHRDFEDYLQNLNCKKRRHVKRSQRKFEQSGLRVVQLSGRDLPEDGFTEEVYGLYEAVYDHSERRLEKLPIAFFREMAARLPDQSVFTFIYDGDRIVAFTISVFDRAVYRAMFCGYDYPLNPKADLYFNLMFHTVDRGYRQNVSDIIVGQGTYTFKRRRLGCHRRPRYFYIKGTRPLASYLIRSVCNKVFAPANTNGEPASSSAGREQEVASARES